MATESLALQLRVKRSEMMTDEVEAVAMRLFEQRGFGEVTVDDIAASEAGISGRARNNAPELGNMRWCSDTSLGDSG